ncbi:hypothetical protein A8C32_16790 [Flavivirga aquatica]|uniref:Lipid/polyisoprenoid-binding YceI-like domain-containing protein n=1 Tax=Flavivirga aquatica TaxID=1849968 RepID=A0A1E5T8L2_9FLAO|nr:YceI family protein [Flavivirga aquatica]OEK07710.1 hypothetical protein A8C32_16790 [Flavivirga aquatica]
MKHLFFIILFFVALNSLSQNKYITKTGHVSFEASASSLEEVKAINSSVTAIFNTENGDFAALILVKGFRFKNALMEEHFNENYAESDKYPKATFKGKIQNFSLDNLSTINTFKINGVLMFHGKTKQLNNVILKVNRHDNVITTSGKFNVKVSDFDIKIPKIVGDKISESVEIIINFSLEKK